MGFLCTTTYVVVQLIFGIYFVAVGCTYFVKYAALRFCPNGHFFLYYQRSGYWQ